jgi:hypothetical protein
MKQLILSALFVCVSISIFAQKAEKRKVKVKDDIVYFDKIPALKIEGKTSRWMGSVDVEIKTMGGKTLFSVSSKSSGFNIPDYLSVGYSSKEWVEVDFVAIGKKMAFNKEVFASKKGVAKYFLEEAKYEFITDSTLNTTGVDAFIKDFDILEKIEMNNKRGNDFEKILISNMGGGVSRNFKKPVYLNYDRAEDNAFLKTAVYKIYQDSVEIGELFHSNQVAGLPVNRYQIYKKVSEPVELMGKITNYIYLGKVESANFFPEVVTVSDKKVKKFDNNSSEGNLNTVVLANYLISAGYL